MDKGMAWGFALLVASVASKGKGFRKISRVVFNYQSSFFEDFTKARDSLYIDTAWTQKIKKIFSKKIVRRFSQTNGLQNHVIKKTTFSAEYRTAARCHNRDKATFQGSA